MEMYKELLEYYDSKDLSTIQEEWEQLESHKYEGGVCVDDLFDFWDNIYLRPDDDIFIEPEKIKFTNLTAPILTEHFFLNKYGYRKQSSILS
jgi:hypothetical protein